MKNFKRFLAVFVVLLFAFNTITTSAAPLIARLTAQQGTVDDAWVVWNVPAGTDTATISKIVIEHSSPEPWPWGYMLGFAGEEFGWEAIDGGDRVTHGDGETIVDLTGLNFEGYERVQFAGWFDGDRNRISAIRFYGPAEVVAVVTAANPPTGDNFSPLWLIVSGVGLVAALATFAGVVVFKKKK